MILSEKVVLWKNLAPILGILEKVRDQHLRGGGEHLKDLDFRRPKSHLLRHCVEEHPNIAPENVDFRMKVLSVHRSAFERQIREAVVLDYVASPLIMNSKLEYTRCGIPKMELRLGNKEIEERKGVAKEKDTIEKIKMLYKGENKRTKKDDDHNMDGRGGKRKKMDLPPVIKLAQNGEIEPKSDLGPECFGPRDSPNSVGPVGPSGTINLNSNEIDTCDPKSDPPPDGKNISKNISIIKLNGDILGIDMPNGDELKNKPNLVKNTNVKQIIAKFDENKKTILRKDVKLSPKSKVGQVSGSKGKNPRKLAKLTSTPR